MLSPAEASSPPRGRLARGWRNLPAILAFALLAFQVILPWTTPRFTTQDGPSHLYTGVVLRDILLHPHGPRAAAYSVQRGIVPNWTSALLLGAAASAVGAAHAEQLLAGCCLMAGFFGFEYLCRALKPGPAWSPIANFLFQNWFLWIGFYNFYLGMALCPFVAGYYIRHRRALTIRRTALLALGMSILFFTHIMAAALVAIAMGLLAVWNLTAESQYRVLGFRKAAGRVGLLVAAMLPTVALAAFFATGSSEGVHFKPEIARAWSEFPKGAFLVGSGRAAREDLLWPAVFFAIAISVLALRRREWRGPKGGVAIVTVVLIGLYLFTPDDGFGGQEIKKRLAWAVFLIGSPLVCSAARLRPLRTPIAIYTAVFLAASLTTSMRVSHSVAGAAGEFLSSMSRIPPGATFVRVYYPIPNVAAQFGFEDVPFTPLFHTDAYVAATRRLVDLSDYQAASGLFAVVYDPIIDTGHRYNLWGLENAANKNFESLKWLRETLPIPIDYVVVVGDETSADAKATDMSRTLAALDATMRLLPRAAPRSFVRVYQRIGAR
ncbi:MAG: hypothetical protein ACR2I2_03795 [Bryobacteraceae bacterium]